MSAIPRGLYTPGKELLLNVSVKSKRGKKDLQAQRILANLTISASMRSIRCIQDRWPRCIQSEDVKVDTPTSVAWHRSIGVMRRIEGRRDRIFRVRLASRDGDRIVRDEERGNV